ncbi:hypothetical protein F5X68DRAFT_216776 [Plectosphaerella plurivora]|uniref:DUF7730 domain-containing protein n=1 Tax=Plectosphaerella plurivora TaxID=936078 RepID=A0A9P8V2R3_9PEZI|nr:hypothetical protein F5X68DRAFT_216776 [Plectosphaerella plurivora]
MNSATFRRGKRYGVLGSQPDLGSAEAELWETNQKTSPLLCLPPEIRNRIYELVLANHRIHVLHTPLPKKTGVAPGETPRGGFHCIILHRRANPFGPDKLKARHVLARGLTLLSPVCRQLYHETALIPYATGTWSFASPGLMERYLLLERRLPVLQRRAVRRLVVRGIQGNGTLSRRMRLYLGGLEVVWFWEPRNGWVEERVWKEIDVEDGIKTN